MGLQLHTSPSIRILVEGKEHSLLIRFRQMFLQGSDKLLGFFLTPGFIKYNGGNRFRFHRRRGKQLSHFRQIISISSLTCRRNLFTGNRDNIQILQNTA